VPVGQSSRIVDQHIQRVRFFSYRFRQGFTAFIARQIRPEGVSGSSRFYNRPGHLFGCIPAAVKVHVYGIARGQQLCRGSAYSGTRSCYQYMFHKNLLKILF
jgi:hypothetical protein